MGTRPLAISNLVRAVYILVMSPILAFSHSTITIIGQLYGSGKYLELKPALWKLIQFSIVFTLPFSLLMCFYPEGLMMIFTNDASLLKDGKPVMQIVSLALLCFATSLPLLSAVTGLGQTNKALLVESVSFVIYLFTSILFIFLLHLPLPLVWCNEFIYFVSISFLSYYFFEKKSNLLLFSYAPME